MEATDEPGASCIPLRGGRRKRGHRVRPLAEREEELTDPEALAPTAERLPWRPPKRPSRAASGYASWRARGERGRGDYWVRLDETCDTW
eukprot:1743075-Rhodomonas_salina.1